FEHGAAVVCGYEDGDEHRFARVGQSADRFLNYPIALTGEMQEKQMGLKKTVRKAYRGLADRAILGKIRSYAEIDGFLTRAEAAALHRCASMLPPGSKALEIGCWKGKSTYCIASGLASGKVYAIDPFNAAGESGSKEVYDHKKGEAPLIEQFKENMR